MVIADPLWRGKVASKTCYEWVRSLGQGVGGLRESCGKKTLFGGVFLGASQNFEGFSFLVILGVGDAKMFWKLDGSWKVYSLPESSSSPWKLMVSHERSERYPQVFPSALCSQKKILCLQRKCRGKGGRPTLNHQLLEASSQSMTWMKNPFAALQDLDLFFSGVFLRIWFYHGIHHYSEEYISLVPSIFNLGKSIKKIILGYFAFLVVCFFWGVIPSA